MPELEGLTPAYINEHMTNVQTYDSFGRTLVQMIMTEAREKATGAEAEMEVSITFTVSKAIEAGCFKICPKKWFCIHIS